MTHVPHELLEEFADDHAILHDLKMNNAHFNKIAATYHEVNQEIYRIEAEITPAADETLENFKKERLKLLDEVAALIAKAKAKA